MKQKDDMKQAQLMGWGAAFAIALLGLAPEIRKGATDEEIVGFAKDIADKAEAVIVSKIASLDTMICVACGCTEDDACKLADGTCSWARRDDKLRIGICTNPECATHLRAWDRGTRQ